MQTLQGIYESQSNHFLNHQKLRFMKQITRILSFAALALSVSATSCKKDDSQPASTTKQALIAKTWQVETVIDYHGATPNVLYQRGAANNEDDHSLVRQTFKADGSITYVDQFGTSGTDGRYELFDNDRKMKIGAASVGFTTIVENVKANATQFAYTLNPGDGDSTRFVFSPL